MSRKRFASVWDAIEDSATEAASMKLRAEIANEVIERLRKRKVTQSRAAALLGVTQPRISDLMRGRLDLFSLDSLVDMADRAGLQTRLVIRPKRAAQRRAVRKGSRNSDE
jgi:predicted XRE-type DNA-binding protein